MTRYIVTVAMTEPGLALVHQVQARLGLSRSALASAMLRRYGDQVQPSTVPANRPASMGLGLEIQDRPYLAARAQRLGVTRSKFLFFVFSQFLARASEEIPPSKSLRGSAYPVKFSLPPEIIRRIHAMASAAKLDPPVLLDRLIRGAERIEAARTNKIRVQFALRESARLSGLARAGGWSCRSALLAHLVEQAAPRPSTSTSLPPLRSSTQLAPAELVADFVREVYEPTWDEPRKTVLVRGEPAAGVMNRPNTNIQEAIRSVWQVWLKQQKLPPQPLSHAMWQRAMKSHAYSHPTARSLV